MTQPHPEGDASHSHSTVDTGGASSGHEIHSDADEHSIWPVAVALGTLIAAIGLLSWMPIAVLGAVVIVAAIVGWLWQPWEPV